MATAPPTTLSRELLKWIQSLDLSFSVTNAKRNFANGFLVAEIFSRYYDKDLSMHSFSNGTGMTNKRDNWDQLMKFFNKRGIQPGGEPVSQKDVDEIMMCRAGAVVRFLNKVYQFLTGRSIQAAPSRAGGDDAPSFARPTATLAIRETLRDPGVDSITDLSSKESKMREALSQHELSLAEDKLRDPSRYARRNKIVRGSTRTVGREESKSSVEIKQVAVKSVDSNVAHLRATKELQASTARLTGTGAGMGTASRSVLPDFDAAGVVPAVQTMNTCVQKALAGREEMAKFDPSLPVALAFVDQLTTSPTFPHALAVDVFRELMLLANAEALADACLLSPRDFYQVVSVYQPVISVLPESSVAFPAAIDSFLALGKIMMAKDNHMSVKLFRDFAMPSLTPLVKRVPTKRHAVLRVMYGYSITTPAGRLQAIRTLQQHLDDLTAFVHCLTVLIFLEDSFNDDLLDLYLYYTLIGMGMSSPSLRAACVAMLSVVAAHNADVGPGVVDRLVKLRTDTWWEVKAQLLIVSSALLQRMTPATESASVKALLSLVTELVHPSCGPVLLRVGVAYLSPVLRSHPALLEPYVQALLALPSVERTRLLDRDGPRDQLPVWGVSGGKYRLPCASNTWPADLVCRTMTDVVARDRLEHLEEEHYEVLHALLQGTIDHVQAPAALTSSAAEDAFKALHNHLFAGLCGADCELAVRVLQDLMAVGLSEAVLSSPSLEGTLVLLHRLPPGDTEVRSQQLVATFLSEAARGGAANADLVTQQLSKFKEAFGEELLPPFAALMEELGL